MSPRLRHVAALFLAWALIASLMYLGREQPSVNRFDQLLLGLVLLAAYWEELTGALLAAAAGLLAVMVGYRLGWLPSSHAIADLIGLGLVFLLAGIWSRDRDKLRRQCRTELHGKDKRLLAIRQRVERLRGQLEIAEGQYKGLTRIYDVTKKLSGILDLKLLLDEARMIAAKIFPAHASPAGGHDVQLAFYLPEPDSGAFRREPAMGQGFSDASFPERMLAEELRQAMGESFSSRLIPDASLDRGFGWLHASTGFQSLIAIPLVTQEVRAGVMIMASASRNVFSVSDLKQAEVLGKQIVLALRKCLLYHEVEKLSYTDTQTGLYVHRFFQERLRLEIHRHERYRQPLSLIMFDMDHFKHVNDQYGHQAGDEVLAVAAGRIKEAAGPTALVARYGGEEFAVLLPNTPKTLALKIGKDIQTAIKAAPIPVPRNRLTVTISGGVSAFPGDALDLETLIVTADTALYEAKRKGRDLVLGYEGAAPVDGRSA